MDGSQTIGTSPILEMKDLVVEFPTHGDRFRAVDHVSLSVRPGETHCIVGESGSGKSVTARAILQIVDRPGEICGGEILFKRRPSEEHFADPIDLLRYRPTSSAMRDLRGKDIAMIFQEPMTSLSPVHRIGAQVGEALRIHEGLSRRQARLRAIELLNQVGIRNPDKAVDQYPFEFSGGMRQRAVIAMALSCKPSLLIADEPTTALDVTIQKEILDLIKTLQVSHEMAVLFITHDMGVVSRIADTITVMRHGRVLETGDAKETLQAPKDKYTQELIQKAQELDRPSPVRVEMRSRRAPGDPILKASNVGKSFVNSRSLLGKPKDVFVALEEASLTLRKGENLGVVGESGSGKTTLARCIQRVFQLSEGRLDYVTAEGQTVDLAAMNDQQLRPIWRDVRTVFQDPHSSLNPRMTVGEIIAEPLRNDPNGPTGAALHNRVSELLDLVELPASTSIRYPHSFSGGQRQRIAIARAIGPNPRVILADEPTSALDVALRTNILNLLLRLQERLDLSFVFVSHDIAVIRYFCDRIAVMKDGRIVEMGETETVCSSPEHPYTKLLLSAVLRV